MKKSIKKKRKRTQREENLFAVKLVIGVFGGIMVGVLIICIVGHLFPYDAATVRHANALNVAVFSENFKYEEEYFNTIDEAVDRALLCYGADIGEQKDKTYEIVLDGYLFMVEDEDAISVMTLCNWKDVKSDKVSKTLVSMTFDKVDNQISSVKYIHQSIIQYPLCFDFPNTIYENDEAIAAEIMDSMWLDTFSRANNDISVAYGISDSEAIKTLTILGEAPDGIEEIEKDGVTYYFWYYTDVDMLMPIRENLNLNEYYLPEVVECLDIQVEDPAEMEE